MILSTILDTRDTSVSSSRLDYEVFLDTQETQSLISELDLIIVQLLD